MADKTKLSEAEIAAAKAAGMSPERWAALKQVRTLADWEQLQKQKECSTD